MNYGMLNLGSVLLGLLAKGWKGLRRLAPVLSMGACALAVWLQICYDEHLVNLADWSALMDTIGAVRKVSLFLLGTTLLLNLGLAFAEREESK